MGNVHLWFVQCVLDKKQARTDPGPGALHTNVRDLVSTCEAPPSTQMPYMHLGGDSILAMATMRGRHGCLVWLVCIQKIFSLADEVEDEE